MENKMNEQIKVVSCESGDCEELIIITEGMSGKHEWVMQTTEGEFDSSLGCLQFLNGEEFNEDNLTEIENLHYAVANDCFNENAMRFYEEKKAEEIEETDQYFYAESKGFMVTEDIYEGGFLRYEKDSQPYCDLFRFDTEEERSLFINNSENATSISAIEAMKNHEDQFHYWNNQS